MDDISHENIVNDLRRRIEYNLDELHHITTWGLIGLSVITFIACMKITAPYGRHSDSKLGKKWWWGPSIPATIAWIIMECPSPILAAYFWFYGGRSSLSLLYIIVFLSHYLNRFALFFSFLLLFFRLLISFLINLLFNLQLLNFLFHIFILIGLCKRILLFDHTQKM